MGLKGPSLVKNRAKTKNQENIHFSTKNGYLAGNWSKIFDFRPIRGQEKLKILGFWAF